MFYQQNGRNYSRRGYEYECLKCGYHGKKLESDFLKGHGCPVCSNHIVIKGINDMWTTNPELAKLLANPDDGYKYTQCSNKRTDWECPDCGTIIKNKSIYNIYKDGLSCPKCSGGVSFAERLMYNLLEQLKLDFEYQYTPDWIKPKRYDFYVPQNKIAIEMDGDLGHGKYNPITKENGLDSKKEDIYKDKLAEQHNIEIIRIDCRNHEGIVKKFDYIKKSILHSKLITIFDFNDINWNVLFKNTQKNIVKIIAEYKKNHQDMSTYDIGKIFQMSPVTIKRYLIIGNKLNWCHYNVKERTLKQQNLGRLNRKKVICIDSNKIFNSLIEASAHSGIERRAIGNCCNHRTKSSGGLHWMFYNEYIEQQGVT